MGQYHTVYNTTKKEYLSICGAKLWEKAYSSFHSMALNVLLCNSNGRGGGDLNNPIIERYDKKGQYKNTYTDKKSTKTEYIKYKKAIESIAGRWAGDKIVIQGDYAKESDTSYLVEEEHKNYKSINTIIFEAFEILVGDEEEFKAILNIERNFIR